MAKSVQIRVDKEYAKMLVKMKKQYSRQIGKPITIVQVTRILKDNINKPHTVFYKERNKRIRI